MLRPLLPCILACAVALASCAPSVEVADDSVACADARCTAGECYATGGQPACRCGPWEEAASVPCVVAAFEDEDDHGGSPATATVLTLPMDVRTAHIGVGRRDGMVDRDLFAFTALARHAYAFHCGTRTLVDCKMRVLDASGTSVPLQMFPQPRMRAGTAFLGAGTWYLEVAGGVSTGEYTYQVVDLGADDHGDTRQTATRLQSSREPFPVRHSYVHDPDVFSFHVLPDHGYRFACESADSTFHELWLRTEAGTVVESLQKPTSFRAAVGGRALASEDWLVELRALAHTVGQEGTSSCRFEDLGLDEHSDVAAGATPITPGLAVPVALQWDEDVDVVSFQGQPGHVYVLRTEPPASLQVEVTSEQGQGWSDSLDKVFIKPAVVGTWYLHLEAAESWQRSFLLAVVDLGLDDHGDGAFQATPIEPGGVATGRFSTPQDTDAFSFMADADGIYLVDCEPACDVSLDPADGPLPGFVSVSPGRYVVDARWSQRITLLLHSRSGAEGFTLRLTREATDDHADDDINAIQLPLPVSVSGVVQTVADVDVFSVRLAAGRVYLLNASLGALRLELRDPGGSLVTPRTSAFVAQSSGLYLVSVTGATGLAKSPWSVALREQ